MPLLNAAARNDAKERFHPLAHAVVVEAYVAAQPSSGAGGEGNGVASLLKLESDQVRKQIAGATEGVKVLMGNLADAVVNKAQTGDDRFPCATLIDDPEPAKAKAKKNIIDTICTGYLNILSKEASEIATTTGTGGESHKTAVEHLQPVRISRRKLLLLLVEQMKDHKNLLQHLLLLHQLPTCLRREAGNGALEL
eukprot:g6249.t1